MEILVRREGEDLWKVEPQDETWLPLATRNCFARNPLSVAAVLKPHPQDEGVRMRGTSGELLEGIAEAKKTITKLRQSGLAALRCGSYALACLVRRALLTRPMCLAAVEVTFTNHVEESEFEPVAAHRLGQLVYRADTSAELIASQAFLRVPPGECAMAKHLVLPSGIHLYPGQETTALGLRASRAPSMAGEMRVLAIVELRPGSVFLNHHARHCCVAGLEYYPEVRIKLPFPRKGCKEHLRQAGLDLSNNGVISSTRFQVRQEYVQQLLPEATFDQPRFIQLDFEPLGLSTREEVLRSSFDQLLLEMNVVESQLREAAALPALESAQMSR